MILITLILLSISSSLFIENVDSAKILYLTYIGCKSAFSLHQTVSKILLNHHHEIVAINPLPFGQTHPNYTDLGVQDAFYQYSDQVSIEDDQTGTYINRKLGYEIHITNCENLYKNNKLVETLKNLRVDLILLEIDVAECYYPLLAHIQAPLIGVSSHNILFSDIGGTLGTSANPSYVPTTMSGFSTKMDFLQRLQNAKDYILHTLIPWYCSKEINSMAAKYLENPASTDELFDRVSLVFTNDHFSFLSRPVAPSTVGIGGIHIGNPSPLPKEIQTFMDGASEGVIYLSLGSVVAFSRLPKHIQDSFVNVLQKSPYRIIWRHDKPEIVQLTSKNFLVQKWLPQRDILAHPKVILFISHAGIFSTYEAIHFGVPMLTFPVLYDQFTNAAIIDDLGIGIVQELRNFSEQALSSGINEIIQNRKYRENMRKLSEVFKDRPLSPQDTLLYWIDYVLRHKDVSYLKPTGAKLPFYQYLLLDVILFVIATLILAIWFIYLILKIVTSTLKKLFTKESAIKKPKTS